jgi:tetratricopeptide (TPR) repeat protein
LKPLERARHRLLRIHLEELLIRRTSFIWATAFWACVVFAPAPGQIRTLGQEEVSPPAFSSALADLPLQQSGRAELESALKQRDYKQAEKLLVGEAERDPKSERAAKLLSVAGGIFFLDEEYLNSIIAWKKSDAITPLDDRNRFTLAMAYIKLNRREWARPELEKLASVHPKNALYQYWLSRLDYDARNYAAAIARLQTVIQLDPTMMRAYDTLGLCQDYLGHFEEAIKSYNTAVELNRSQAKPSPWPHVDLAVSLVSVNRLPEAEKNLREALRYDANLPQAHYQLGRVLEMRGDLQSAVEELKQAAELEPSYPEPHFLLGRIYHKLGNEDLGRNEVATYERLKKAVESASQQASAPSHN